MGILRICGLASCLALLFQRTVGADTGIGFGWDATASQEVAYRVDLSTGDASAIGVVPDLQYVLVGGHQVDYPTGVTALLGSTAGDQVETLFVLVPASRLIYAFRLLGLTGDMVVQRALMRSVDGAIYVIVTDRAASGTVALAKVTLDESAGTATAATVATLPVAGFGSDSVRIGDDGKVYVLTASGTADSLVTADTETGAITEVALAGPDHRALFLCNQVGTAPRLFTLLTVRSPAVVTSLTELAPDGTETVVADHIDWSFLAGSLGCTNEILQGLSPLAGGAHEVGVTLATFDLANPSAGVQTLPLSQPDLKTLGVTSASVAAIERPLRAASGPAKFKLLARAALAKCLKQIGNRRLKTAEFGAVARTLANVKRRAGRCKVR